jgi:hypothetical protein
MTSSYERLQRAVSILQDGPGTIQERLASAYWTEVQYMGPEGLDEATAYLLEGINDELTRIEAEGDRDTIDMSTSSLTDAEAQELGDRIRGLREYFAKQQPAP